MGSTISWLLSSALKSGLLIAAAWLGAALLRRSTAAARHHIWTLGVAGALLLPLLAGVLPSVTLGWETPMIGAERSLLATGVSMTGSGTTDAWPTWPTWLAMIWGAGTLLVSIRFLRGHIAAHRVSRAAEPGQAAAWSSARSEAASSLGIIRDVVLGRSAAIGSPMTVGVLRPRVLLPAAADGWSPQRLRTVLMHELGHVRRHDTLIQLGAQLACALYWWNPLTWLAAARLRIEREHACDDLVLAAGIRPSSYAADLLEVARAISPVDAGAVCMVDRSWTEARVHRILDPGAPRRPPGVRFRRVALGATLAFAVTLACTSAARETPAGAPVAQRKQAEQPEPALFGSLWVGEPTVNASMPSTDVLPPFGAVTLDLSLVAKEVDRHRGELQACYDRRLRANPQLAGKVVMHWAIGESGKVEESCITEDTIADQPLVDCLNHMVKHAQFPPARNGSMDISFPFVFMPTPAVRDWVSADPVTTDPPALCMR